MRGVPGALRMHQLPLVDPILLQWNQALRAGKYAAEGARAGHIVPYRDPEHRRRGNAREAAGVRNSSSQKHFESKKCCKGKHLKANREKLKGNV